MIKGLTPYQILEKLTGQTKKERCEAWWKKGSMMKGQQFFRRFITIFAEKNLCSSELQSHSGKNLDLSTFSHREIEKGYASLLYHIGFSRHEGSITSGGLVPRSFGTSKGRKAVYFSLASQLDPNPDPKHKPYFHLKCHHDQMFVIDLEAAQNSLEFYQTANGSVLCYDAVPSEFLAKITNFKYGSERFEKEELKEEESSPTKRSRRDQGQSRETSWHYVRQEIIEPRQLGEISRTAEEKKKQKQRSLRSMQVLYQKSRLGTVLCRCGKKLGGLTAVQEKNAQVTNEKGSHLIQPLVQLRIVEEVRGAQRHGTSEDSKVLGIHARPFLKMHEERNRDPIDKQKTINFEGCVDRREKKRRLKKTYDPKRTYKGRPTKL